MSEQQTMDSIGTSAYQALFQHTHDAVVVLDNKLMVCLINPAMEEMLTQSEEAVMGADLSTLLKSAFDMDVPLKDLHNLQIKRTVDEVTSHFKISVHTLPDSRGYLLVLRDVTEVARLKADYSNFAHTLGHDVKSPLGVAVGYSNMLQSETKEGSELRYFVDEIFNTTMRIMNICNELVLLSELEHITHTDTMPVDMQYVLENAIRRFQHVTQSRTITPVISEKLDYAKGNAPWVEEAIVDYLHYAIIDNPSSKIITIHITSDETHVQFAINHDGTDMPVTTVDEMFSEIFDITTIRAEGYGLGLGVAKRLIGVMNGQVDIKDNALTFSLPVSD